MKLEISAEELEDILSGKFEKARNLLSSNILNTRFAEYQKGAKAAEDKIYQYLMSQGYSLDCKHGRPVWSCKECLK